MATSTAPITAEQLFAMPDDNLRRELVRGEVISMNPAGFQHGTIVAGLTALLAAHVRQHRLGLVCGAETGFLLARDPDTVRAPDIALVSQQRLAKTGVPESFFPGAPDLAVEIVSPNDRQPEVEAKVADWLRHGAGLVWVVYPRDRTVTVYKPDRSTLSLGADGLLTAPDLLPGFSLRVADIFPQR